MARLRVATALGHVAIGAQWLDEIAGDPGAPLIAHVHVDNALPRGLLVDQLGFVQNGRESAPGTKAPPNMRRNPEGDVVGDVFVYPPAALRRAATWLQTCGHQVTGKRGTLDARIGLSPFDRAFDEAVADLLHLAESSGNRGQ